MGKQYWADASTQNCVWMFQVKHKQYADGCHCEIYDEDGCLKEGKTQEDEDNCNCYTEHWETEAVYLTRVEANHHGEARPYAWGKKGEGWRIYGVPAKGIMVDILGQHNKEFEGNVEHITEYDVKDEEQKGCGRLFEQEDDVGETVCKERTLCPDCVKEGKRELEDKN